MARRTPGHMRLYWILGLFSLTNSLFAGSAVHIETSDIDRFWKAYDQLAGARTQEDSVRIFQEGYIDPASEHFQRFIRIRDFTAKEYVKLIRQAPKFWASIRPVTERIAGRTAEIQATLDSLAMILPGFTQPDVCFAIGCLRTGGTTSKNLILIGAEIAAADGTVDKSELNAWLQGLLGNTGDIVAMVAHEAVHTQQRGFPLGEFFSLLKHKRLTLLNTSIVEGSADFITHRFLGLNINSSLHAYGEAHHEQLWCEFALACDTARFDYGHWLYAGPKSKDRPADLGYYIGCRMSAAFYDAAANKQRALKTLLKRGKYKKVYRQSGYKDIPCA